MLHIVLFLWSFAVYSSMLDALCTLNHVTVTGQLGCVDPDDILNMTKTDNKGYFTIYGEECEIIGIEPYLRITHNCEDGALSQNCIITDDFPIPRNKIGSTYKMGIISLNIARMNHKKNCR
ncbi:Transthyretin-like protein 16 [Dirofilaria immitis]|nr:Transthyretin-like protein 16 [Dirofilaria immitis]